VKLLFLNIELFIEVSSHSSRSEQMEGKILVAFGTKHGATQEIAEKIGETLKKAGLQAEVLSAQKVREAGQYKAAVIGSAAYIFQWRSEVVKLLQKNERVFSGMPVWLFSSGPVESGDPLALLKGIKYPPKLQPLIDQIKPREIAVFHGRIDINKLNWWEKWIFNKINKPAGDFRDWEAITGWAGKIAEEIKNLGLM
jgi:menaquinone-dependent protoporphyrinogen oxidase